MGIESCAVSLDALLLSGEGKAWDGAVMSNVPCSLEVLWRQVGGLSPSGDRQQHGGQKKCLRGPRMESLCGHLTTSISCAIDSPNFTMTTSEVLGTGRDHRL